MFVRAAAFHELDRIFEIYEAGKRYMRAHGNHVQWVGEDYPARAVLEADIACGDLLVVADREVCGPCDGAEYGRPADGTDAEPAEKIYGVFSFKRGADPTYAYIENGAWNSDAPYATVHRVASSGEVKGIGDCLFGWAAERCREEGLNLRCDTHELNLTMQNLLKKQGFEYCGIIYEPDDTPRLAFQKIIR